MTWQQSHWEEKVKQNSTKYLRTYLVPPWTDDDKPAKFKFGIETADNTNILSLECRIIAKSEVDNTDVTHRFYLKDNQPTHYKRNKESSVSWPPINKITPCPTEFITGKSYKYLESLAQQVPSLEQSLHQLSSIIDRKYSYTKKE